VRKLGLAGKFTLTARHYTQEPFASLYYLFISISSIDLSVTNNCTEEVKKKSSIISTDTLRGSSIEPPQDASYLYSKHLPTEIKGSPESNRYIQPLGTAAYSADDQLPEDIK
jgi:hypothetical protein